jgi:hypothetical protein
MAEAHCNRAGSNSAAAADYAAVIVEQYLR